MYLSKLRLTLGVAAIYFCSVPTNVNDSCYIIQHFTSTVFQLVRSFQGIAATNALSVGTMDR